MNMNNCIKIALSDIRKAHEKITPHIHFTPYFRSSTLDLRVGRNVFFKAENLQKTGSFKARGALNAVLSLKASNPDVHGVVTHSSGNHGQALAWAAKTAGVKCSVVVPNNSPKIKSDAILGYGAELVFCEPTPADRQATCDRVSKERNFTIVPPYDHYDVIAGQGTIAVEFLKQVPDLDAILVPVSGGGMTSGIAIAAKAIKPDIKGERLWPNPPRFLNTIADGIRLQQLGDLTWPIILELVEKDVFSVKDDDIVKAMRFVFERMKLVIEPASGAGVAAVMSERLASMDPGLRNIGVILCGGNVDIDHLPWC
ncbi:serine racemase-like isoform X2 [Ostrea edulis]|uniref:serine racemase-like isoform X2 n=1 Tax=Ostrea edulis TaxID=37623 RepID=UPI0024AF8850|nr:serine racemase-like isoform X2 [Ostrea edulis]